MDTPMTGGNMNEVYRDGDTVLRKGGPWTPTVHRYLRYLDIAGVGWAPKVPSEVICHNDFAPHNLAFENGRVVGAIDFDMCSPGPRLWDIAYFATRAVPLTAVTPAGAPGMDDTRRRTRIILDAYGSGASWQDVVRVAIIRLLDLATISRQKAGELGKPRLLLEAEEYERDADFLSGLSLGDRRSGALV